MAYREVTMVEVKEVLRQWLAGGACERIAARLGPDPKTVRRYLRTAERRGLARTAGEAPLTDEWLLRRRHGDPCRNQLVPPVPWPR